MPEFALVIQVELVAKDAQGAAGDPCSGSRNPASSHGLPTQPFLCARRPAGAVCSGIRGGGYHVVERVEPPHTINVCPDLPDDDDGAGIESLTPDGIVVPIAASRDTIDFETTSLYATMANIPKTLQHRGHPLVLAFALTDFKIQ